MKLLYVSVHSVLEDDEIRMLKALGHDVFPLGVNFGFDTVEPYRAPIHFNDREHALLDTFRAMGGVYRYAGITQPETVVPADFVAQFDAVIVMHDLEFIHRAWPVLSQVPVIWRTIGQNIEGLEPLAAALTGAGLRIVRYSPVERKAAGYAGETALIRFAKNAADHGPWAGTSRQMLTFANAFAQRYPQEAATYAQVVEGLPAMLGGEHNAALPGAIGLQTSEQQRRLYEDSRAYFYCSGRQVPYTLNFIEALMTGIPVVAFDPVPRSPWYEVPDLLAGGAGIVVSTVAEARAAIQRLLDDEAFARETSVKGRARALELFDGAHIGPQWNAVLESIRRR